MMTSDSFIYGKHPLTGVVGIEVADNGEVEIYTKDGILYENTIYYILVSEPLDNTTELKGDLHYKYAIKFDNRQDFQAKIGEFKALGVDYHAIYNPAEMFMLRHGYTYYKGMKPENLDILSFDIETTSLSPENGKVLLITNTYRCGNRVERLLFSYDDYNSQKEMIYAWCAFVREIDPDVIVGHNIFNFDLPYLKSIAGKLPIGRDESSAKFARYTSKFRKDGSQSYDYQNVTVYGREIIDTFHLSIKYDVARNYPSYKLKEIVKYEGLEKADRQHYDASKIRLVYENTAEWNKIKKYAEEDADDALALFDLMIPSFFYYTQSLPKTLQQVINGASGAQVDSFMKRAYLQEGHSLPLSSRADGFEGAISFGNPGLYKNVFKVDVASLYPSIILSKEIYDNEKDPKKYFLQMVRYFTDERLNNKRLAKETGDRYYRDLEQSQKIFIDSAYGFMGANGLLFNSPHNAKLVTRTGREILTEGIKISEARGYETVNADTDSFSFTGGNKLKDEDFKDLLDSLNSIRPGIVWEDDGFYKKVLIVKAKNYVLDDGKKIKIKGSSLKATMKEPALKEYISEVITYLIKDRKDELYDHYMDYANRINNISHETIKDWCSKKTITKSVLFPERTNEERVKAAIESKPVEEGDKIHIFFETETSLSLLENFNGTYCKKTLYNKLYKTLSIFNTVLDIDIFPNFSLKRNEARLGIQSKKPKISSAS